MEQNISKFAYEKGLYSIMYILSNSYIFFFSAVKNVRGEYYLNGHWTIEYSRALHIGSTILHYYRGSEGDLAPEVLTARGPTTEPLVIEVCLLVTNEGETNLSYCILHLQYAYYC